jgi:hypothetical protein
MRLNECQQVKETLMEHLGINLTVVDGADLFLGRLKGVTEPEKKRKIIGETCTTPCLSCPFKNTPPPTNPTPKSSTSSSGKPSASRRRPRPRPTRARYPGSSRAPSTRT